MSAFQAAGNPFLVARPAKIQNELVKLETALNLWDATLLKKVDNISFGETTLVLIC